MFKTGPLPAFEDRAPRNRYCDLILTGGVTSSIAYPAAVFTLATAYRFNSIGGSSSGAGAAALAAAAEYRRRHGSADGFRLLLERTAEVAEEVDGRTRLAWLFQPAPQNRRLFNAMVPGFATPYGKFARLVVGLLREYAKTWAVMLIVALLVITWIVALVAARFDLIDYRSALLIGLIATMLALVAVGLALFQLIARDVSKVVQHDYGLCTGKTSGDPRHLPLTDWLHNLIQEIAGRSADDPPLTFADLASAPGSPHETLGDPSAEGAASINLQMYTANVTHGRPYVFPQREIPLEGEEDDEPQFFFRASEMRRLFPDKVVDYMQVDPITKQSNRYDTDTRPAPARQGVGAAGRVASVAMGTAPVVGANEEPMYRLPRKHLPILVAARMSVSFPVLFTAVPLWIRDGRVEPAEFRRCLFADGSLCSTFPIHLFDSLVPPWPTFGISLHELPRSALTEEGSPGNWLSPLQHERLDRGVVWLPENHLQGKEEHWNEFETETKVFDRLSGFVNALLGTMKDWNDATLARLPGVRERVARVGLHPGIGGLNILMTPDEIRGLAQLGAEAGRLLLNRFARPSRLESGEMAYGWNEHRWVRFNVLLDSLSSSLSGFTWSASHNLHARPIGELIRKAVDEAPLRGDERSGLLAADAAALEGVLKALIEAERALGRTGAGQPYKPCPRPVMRVRPPL
jgi:predicted acylesterase/phospholipase RssA